jgi:hypothetical protein
MARLTFLFAIIAVVVLGILGAGLYLAYGNFAPTPAPVEKVLPNARFPQ